jgi:hypothetical protein
MYMQIKIPMTLMIRFQEIRNFARCWMVDSWLSRLAADGHSCTVPFLKLRG